MFLSKTMYWIVTSCFLCASINVLYANANNFHPSVKKRNIASDRFRITTWIKLGIKKNSDNTKPVIPLEHYLIEKLQNETSARQNLENLCTSYEKLLWIATTRSLMKNFEDTYGYNSVIDRKSIPPEISYHGRTRLVRKMKMLWIVKNVSDEPNVRDLIHEVERSIVRKEFTSMEDFAEAYASLYYELSIILKTRLILPTRGPVKFEYSVWDKSASKAMPVFMSLFNLPKCPNTK